MKVSAQLHGKEDVFAQEVRLLIIGKHLDLVVDSGSCQQNEREREIIMSEVSKQIISKQVPTNYQ